MILPSNLRYNLSIKLLTMAINKTWVGWGRTMECKHASLIRQLAILHQQGCETDFIISVLIATLLFCEVNSYLFFCLKTGEFQ